MSKDYLKGFALDKVIDFGLPEVDDRYHIWRVPLLSKNKENIGEIVIDAITSLINEKKSSDKEILESRLFGRKHQNGNTNGHQNGNSNNDEYGAVPKIFSIF